MPPTSIDEAALREKLRNERDAAAARAVIECAPRGSAYGVDARDPDTFTVRVTWRAALTDSDVRRALAATPRATAANVHVDARQLRVTVRRDATPVDRAPSAVYVERRGKRRRSRASASIEWDAWVDADDVPRLEALVDAVYSMNERMPLVRVWLEPIVAGRTGIDDGRGAEAVVEPNNECVSESEALGAVVGYAVCFAGIDYVPGAFFAYALERFGAPLARMCVWLPPPDDGDAADAVLVVNVRRAALDAQRGADASKVHALRGDPLAERRVRVKRART